MFSDTSMKASHQWARRPADERYTSLIDMRDHFALRREQSHAKVVSTRKILAMPEADNKGLVIGVETPDFGYAPTHWSFGQIAQLAEAPGGYLRTLHERGGAPIVADCVNFGLKFKRNIEDVGLLMHANSGALALLAATGPRYGRIWNSDIVDTLIRKFGDGVTGEWCVPGEYGRPVTVTKDNTTLYASDRDMFVFLANERNKIEVPNRRNGKPGLMARGFWVQNSEVGDSVFLLGTFLFDFICANRIVWGQQEYQEIRIRHTAGAPDRWLEEIQPALIAYANSDTHSIVDAVTKAQDARLEPDKVEEFLSTRFGTRLAQPLMMTHATEEGRPIETLWDVTTAATAYARGITNTDTRLEIERKAGKVMELAA